jgi:hypothetical protein
MKIWNLLEDGNLFNPVKDGHLNDEVNFAQMVSLMGPPLKEFLQRSARCVKYWDAEGMSASGNDSVLSSADLNLGRQLDCRDSDTKSNTRDTPARKGQRATPCASPQNLEMASGGEAFGGRSFRR